MKLTNAQIDRLIADNRLIIARLRGSARETGFEDPRIAAVEERIRKFESRRPGGER